MFGFQRRYSFPTSYLCFEVLRSPFPAARSTLCRATFSMLECNVSHVGAVALSRRIIYLFNDGHIPRQVICASEGAGDTQRVVIDFLREVKTSPSLANLPSLFMAPLLVCPFCGGSCLSRHRAQWAGVESESAVDPSHNTLTSIAELLARKTRDTNFGWFVIHGVLSLFTFHFFPLFLLFRFLPFFFFNFFCFYTFFYFSLLTPFFLFFTFCFFDFCYFSFFLLLFFIYFKKHEK